MFKRKGNGGLWSCRTGPGSPFFWYASFLYFLKRVVFVKWHVSFFRIYISKRTLYEVFEDKETLLREVLLKNQVDKNEFLENLLAESTNVLEVILVCFQKSIEMFHKTNKRFFEDLKKYPSIYNMMKNSREKESESTIAFFKSGVEQGIFRDDVNFAIINLLVREQFDLLLNTNICSEYPFLEVYESIMFTFIRGIATEKGAKVLETFIQEYRKNRIERAENNPFGLINN